MIKTNVKITPKAQELLIKPAAKKRISVEDLASEILNEAIQNQLSQIVTIGEVKKEYPPNPLANKQPYAYYADPEEPAIPIEDWDMLNSYEKDPADRIIVATARVSNCPIVTVDRKILNYSHVNCIPPTTTKGD